MRFLHLFTTRKLGDLFTTRKLTSSLFRAFVLIASRLENPDSHRYVDENFKSSLADSWID